MDSFYYEGEDVDGCLKFMEEEDNKNINVYSSNPTFNITNNFNEKIERIFLTGSRFNRDLKIKSSEISDVYQNQNSDNISTNISNNQRNDVYISENNVIRRCNSMALFDFNNISKEDNDLVDVQKDYQLQNQTNYCSNNDFHNCNLNSDNIKNSNENERKKKNNNNNNMYNNNRNNNKMNNNNMNNNNKNNNNMNNNNNNDKISENKCENKAKDNNYKLNNKYNICFTEFSTENELNLNENKIDGNDNKPTELNFVPKKKNPQKIKDNRFKQIKVHSLKFIINTMNKLLEEPKKLGLINLYLKFNNKVDITVKEKIDKNYNLDILNKTIKEILTNNINNEFIKKDLKEIDNVIKTCEHKNFKILDKFLNILKFKDIINIYGMSEDNFEREFGFKNEFLLEKNKNSKTLNNNKKDMLELINQNVEQFLQKKKSRNEKN